MKGDGGAVGAQEREELEQAAAEAAAAAAATDATTDADADAEWGGGGSDYAGFEGDFDDDGGCGQEDGGEDEVWGQWDHPELDIVSECKGKWVVCVAEGQEERFQSSQVVLPLPGSRIVHPRNEIGALCAQYLFYDGVEGIYAVEKSYSNTFASGKYGTGPLLDEDGEPVIPLHHLHGSYRPLLIVPQHVKCRRRIYETSGRELYNDRGAGGLADAMHMPPEAAARIVEYRMPPDPEECCDPAAGLCRAYSLSFDLPSGTYATMLFRELMKPEVPHPMLVCLCRSMAVATVDVVLADLALGFVSPLVSPQGLSGRNIRFVYSSDDESD